MSQVIETAYDPSDPRFTRGRAAPKSREPVRPEHQCAVIVESGKVGTFVGRHGSLAILQAADGTRYFARGQAQPGDEVRFRVERDPRSQLRIAVIEE